VDGTVSTMCPMDGIDTRGFKTSVFATAVLVDKCFRIIYTLHKTKR
jgi:hypothetical protein